MDPQAVCTLLQNTGNPNRDLRRQAEEQLTALKLQPGFCALLMSVVSNEQVPQAVRHAASIYFKNVAKNNWAITADQQVGPADKQQVRSGITALMLGSPVWAKKTLAEAICLISDSDFPDQWPGLSRELVQRLSEACQQSNVETMDGVLSTMHSVYKRYRAVVQLTEKVKVEILPVIAETGPPLLLMLKQCANSLSTASDPAMLNRFFSTLQTCVEVFYDLTCLDMGPHFEDNLAQYMTVFQQLLAFEHPALAASADDEEGPLETTKARVLETLAFFLQKYDEDFQPYLQDFTQQIWGLLTKVTPAPRYDDMAIGAMDFLTSVGQSIHHKVFQDPQTLHTICEQIIVPNISIRQSDVEMFEEECEEYIRRDIEGSDQHTRRRAAGQLIHGLCKNYQTNVMGIFQAHVASLIQQYKANPTGAWQAKDAAVYLITAMSSKQSAARVQQSGVSVDADLVNIGQFFSENILPDLQDGADTPAQAALPVLKADAIKFVATFRRQIPQASYPACIALLAKWLLAKHDVIVTYAASSIERLLLMTLPAASPGQPAQPYVQKAQMAEMAGPLFGNIFTALQKSERENPYLMQCLMRVIRAAQEHVGPYIEPVLVPLTAIIDKVKKNPTNPQYNHYLFESVSAMVRHNPQQVPQIEQKVYPPFASILQEDIGEFMPYVFQIFAQMMEVRPGGPGSIPGSYLQILPMLPSPVLLNNRGNIPAVVRMMGVFVEKDPAMFAAPDSTGSSHLQRAMGVFQKLISMKMLDHEGFNILNSVILHVPYEQVQPLMPTVFQIIFSRLSSTKTVKFCRMLIIFCAIFVVKRSPDELIQIVEGIQPGIWRMVFNNIWCAHVHKVTGANNRKACVVGMTRLICESNGMQTKFTEEWAKCVYHTVGMITGTKSEACEEGNLFDMKTLDAASLGQKYDAEDAGYTNAYCPLQGAQKEDTDYCAQLGCPAADFFKAQWAKLMQSQSAAQMTQLLRAAAAQTPGMGTHLQYLGIHG